MKENLFFFFESFSYTENRGNVTGPKSLGGIELPVVIIFALAIITFENCGNLSARSRWQRCKRKSVGGLKKNNNKNNKNK